MNLKNQEGFTIVEVLVALVFLIIIIFAFTNLLATGHSGIFRAGQKSEALFYAQEDIDNQIAGGSGTGSVTHTISFSGIDPIPIAGEEIEITYQYGDHSDQLYYFIPKGD